MARYRGPKHKLCRRLGSCIWGSAKCPANRRPFPPGQHGQETVRRKLSVYAQQLLQKQKLRRHYGLQERQLRKIYKEAQRLPGNTGTNLLALLETRLDAVIYRLGFAPTIDAARQFVNHGHVLVDNKKVDAPSYRVKSGQTISIREKSRKIPLIADLTENPPAPIPEYLERAAKSFEGRVVATPNIETIPFKIDLLPIIGYYSR
ncbi:MAG: 30S ribosomal protein S4 [Candidatus Hydrogenedentes bacterium]|nr:30S ribosomal protein S4 [Candidatus Hydrogenedentota bacterium]